MQSPVYDLPISHDQSRRVISAWIILGLVSLIAAGVFSLLLVLARTPVIQSLIPFVDFFRVALVELCAQKKVSSQVHDIRMMGSFEKLEKISTKTFTTHLSQNTMDCHFRMRHMFALVTNS